jgi:hypothetical protein
MDDCGVFHFWFDSSVYTTLLLGESEKGAHAIFLPGMPLRIMHLKRNKYQFLVGHIHNTIEFAELCGFFFVNLWFLCGCTLR